jgi:hypothetical protein
MSSYSCFSVISDVIHYVQGWSAGDVSLAAYIQAAIGNKEFGELFRL